VAVVMPLTVPGVLRLVVFPVPSCPFVLVPQLHAVPFDVTASENTLPPAIVVTFDSDDTGTGDHRSVVVPSPS
jgi:hypothetical protein